MNKRIYHVDLTLTDACNFQCTYCFEKTQKRNNYFSFENDFIERIYEILYSNFFQSNYDILNIGFWGGEPTLHVSAIREIFDTFAYNDKVKFFNFKSS